MKVRMTAWISGTRDGVDWPAPGGVVDVPAGEARDLLNAGLAEPAERDNIEAATARAPETATRNTTPKKRGLTKGDLS